LRSFSFDSQGKSCRPSFEGDLEMFLNSVMPGNISFANLTSICLQDFSFSELPYMLLTLTPEHRLANRELEGKERFGL